MVKNKIANKLLGMLVAVTMALGMLTNALPVSAGIAEASSATNTTETAFTYASRNVVLDKTAKAYAIDTTATNKMGAEVTKILGNNNNGGTEKAGWISELTDGVFGSFNGAGIAGFNGGNDGRGLGWFVLDAGAQYAVHSVCVDLVHDWGTSDLLIQLSATESFENPITVYSNDVDGSLGYGDVVTGDFSDVYTESIKGGTLMNVLNSGRTFNFAPVSARYIRVTGDAFGNGHRQGYTQFGEIQMFAYETAGTAGPASVAPVTFSSAGGTFSEAAKVTLSAATGAEIYYTTDGSVPTEKSTKYTGEIDTADFSNACVIRAAAKVNGTLGLPTHGTFAHAFTGNPNVALNKTVKAYEFADVSNNVALNKTVKAYAYDSSAANMMGTEITQLRTGGGGDVACSVNDAGIVNGSIDNDIIRSADDVGLWWAVVDFGQSETIESVLVSFWRDDKPQSAMIQLSENEDFSGDDVTTIYCNDVKYGALAGAAQSEALPCVADAGYTITLDTPATGRYLRVIAVTRDNTMWLNEVQAMTYSEATGGNMMGKEITEFQTGGAGNTACSANDAGIVNGVIDLDINRPANGGLWWAVIDFGQSETIGSVLVSFWHDNGSTSAMIQLSENEDFSGDGVTTIYCNDEKYGALAGATQGENLACVSGQGHTITLNTPATGRYLRVIALVREGTMWLNEVKANVYVETPAAPPALQAYVTSVNDAFGEAITLESVANGSSANSITENLPEKVTLVGSDGQEHSNVAGTWSAPEGFDGYTAGNYTFTFTPDSTEGLPVDAYGVATVVVTVEAQADLATLNATLETAAAKQETDYTASTWNAFTQAKTAAETVKNATLKTQREVDKANDDLTAAINALAARADVTELSAELTKHTDKKENQYTTSTWSAFAKAKEAAQAFVNDNSVATQAEVDRAKEELEAAAAALVLRADTTDLSAAYEAARTAYGTKSTSSTYTQQTWSDYLEAMTTAKAIIDDNSNAAQAQADAAKEAIETAIDGFVQKAAQADVDALLAEVTKLRADESKYTVASYAEFKSILGTTEDAVGGAEVTKEAFDAAKAAFDEAKAKLVAVGDATELNALIATKVEAQNAYTTASWKTYSEALSAANTAASGGKPQAEIDAAKAALQTAIDGLVKIGDKTALTDLVAKAKAEKEIGEDLANAINAAQEVLDNADATQTEVDEAVAALQSALDNNKVSGGCGASMAGSGSAVAFVLAAGACALCLKKRKENNIQ